jgi:hypothetical protein
MIGVLTSASRHEVYIVIVAGLSVLGYAVFGYLFLRPTNSGLWNLLSVSVVSLIGLFICIFCWVFPGSMGFNWMIFLIYNLYGFVLFDALNISPSPTFTFWFFVIPSLLLWLGLQLKSAKIQYLEG